MRANATCTKGRERKRERERERKKRDVHERTRQLLHPAALAANFAAMLRSANPHRLTRTDSRLVSSPSRRPVVDSVEASFANDAPHTPACKLSDDVVTPRAPVRPRHERTFLRDLTPTMEHGWLTGRRSLARSLRAASTSSLAPSRSRPHPFPLSFLSPTHPLPTDHFASTTPTHHGPSLPPWWYCAPPLQLSPFTGVMRYSLALCRSLSTLLSLDHDLASSLCPLSLSFFLSLSFSLNLP